jgi:hypothetical protein
VSAAKSSAVPPSLGRLTGFVSDRAVMVASCSAYLVIVEIVNRKVMQLLLPGAIAIRRE